MITYKEYTVLNIINETYEYKKSISKYSSSSLFLNEFIDKIKELKIDEYEFFNIMENLDNLGYTKTIFNKDSHKIYTVKITESGIVTVKNYKHDHLKDIFNKYFWPIILGTITTFLGLLLKTILTK